MTPKRYKPPRELFAEWMAAQYGPAARAERTAATEEGPSNNSCPKIPCAPASIPYSEAKTPADEFAEALSRAGIGAGGIWGAPNPWIKIC